MPHMKHHRTVKTNVQAQKTAFIASPQKQNTTTQRDNRFQAHSTTFLVIYQRLAEYLNTNLKPKRMSKEQIR